MVYALFWLTFSGLSRLCRVEVPFHSSVQFQDVQSGFDSSRRSSRASEIGEGSSFACGRIEWKASHLFLDSASAAVFSTPGKWLAFRMN